MEFDSWFEELQQINEGRNVKVVIIASVANNNVIGNNNDLAIQNKLDMQHFRKETLGHCVIMGRKTCESIPGHYLPGRENFVVSRNVDNIPDDSRLYPTTSLKEAIHHAKQMAATAEFEMKCFIIGGGEIYQQALDLGIVDELVISKFEDQTPDGDTYFPEIDPEKYEIQNTDVFAGMGQFVVYTYARK